MAKNLAIVRLLDEYDGDARIKNKAEMSPIDLTIIDDIKDIKLHFMAQSKYSDLSFKN